jgi:murein DD-endopeptidase MepM/ murein hydrolase activator NlpD
MPTSNWVLTQGDHPAWEWGDGWNGKARDFAPTSGSCTAGINLAAAVLPVAPGTVVAVNDAGAYVAVAHPNGLISFYLHLRPIGVSLGQAVRATTKLGSPSMFGGRAGACHLHLAFATYTGSAPQPGTFNPNRATWLRVFPALADR